MDVFYEPIKTGNFAIVLSVPEEEILAGVTDLQNRLILISATAMVFMAGISYFIAQSITRPVEEVLYAANRMADGDLTVNITNTSKDEPLYADLNAFIDKTQERVTGKVTVKLHMGSVIILARTSPSALYSEELMSFDSASIDQKDAEGFAKQARMYNKFVQNK